MHHRTSAKRVEISSQCTGCAGRGWKFVTARQGLFVVGSDEVVAPVGRVRDCCSWCAGSGLDRAA